MTNPVKLSDNQGTNTQDNLLFHNLIWLTTKEAAIYLRKSVCAVHHLVSKGKIKSRKFANRLYFKREELDYLIDSSLRN
ncbi:MAG: helix-turn-helix domain-containing protein [Halobacteriovoraceae bacterium]|jgi:excisionase family DNA binding protein|nr:helix-turn-helix domain-containing protein [Halobacteriovoraceae bacterium]